MIRHKATFRSIISSVSLLSYVLNNGYTDTQNVNHNLDSLPRASTILASAMQAFFITLVS